jgi:hypothetical protein
MEEFGESGEMFSSDWYLPPVKPPTDDELQKAAENTAEFIYRNFIMDLDEDIQKLDAETVLEEINPEYREERIEKALEYGKNQQEEIKIYG